MKLHLEVNEQKTSVCRPVQFELLGHGFVPTYKKGEKGKYRLMRGWVQYFKHATGYQKFKDLDSWVRCRLRY